MTPAEKARCRGFLSLLRAEPTLMPAVEGVISTRAINRRAGSAGRMCLWCGEAAGPAYVSASSLGPRWLDLCWGCAAVVREFTST